MNKNIPKLRFNEFHDEWQTKKLGEVSTFSKGKSISKSDIDNNGNLECIRYGELYTTYNEIIKNVVSKTNLEKSQLVLSEYNDVIIPSSGETQLDIATASCVLKDGIALGGDLNIIKSNNNGVFLSFYLNHKKKIEIASLAQGNSVVHLYTKQLANLNLNFPTLPEQEKIADFLMSVDEKMEKLKAKKEYWEKYKKGIMQKIFSQEIRFKDNNGNNYPDWQEKRICDIFEITRGYVLSMNELKSDATGDFKYPVYSSQTKEKGLAGYYNQYLFQDCITWTTDGAGAGDVNFRKGKFFCTNVCGVLTNKNGFANTFIAEKLNSVTKKYVSYVGNPKLMNNIMAKIEILIPISVEEQTKIADFLSSIDDKIEQINSEILELSNWKKGLLQQMFV